MNPKVVLVTGVSSGIGEVTARTLAQAGYRVFGTVRNIESTQPAPGVELVQMDVRNEQSVVAGVNAVLASAGRIDIVVNNAGLSFIGPVESTSDAEAKALFDVNVFGVLRVVRAVLPSMRNARRGLIVNVSSVLGFLPAPFMGLYSSSKHAIEGLSETLDHEIRGFGIRVVLVEPSFTNTKLDTNAARTPEVIDDYSVALERSAEAVQKQVKTGQDPAEVARTILKVLDGKYKLRRPAGGSAKLLAVLRRFAPAGQVDKSLRKVFGLQR